MDSTPIFGLPFPEGSDSPDGPAQIEGLATATEELISEGAGFRSSGKSIIAAEQSTLSSSYTLLGTPDRVEDIVLPTDGLIKINYRALVVGGTGSKAAIFLNDEQVKTVGLAAGAPSIAEVAVEGTAYTWLLTQPAAALADVGLRYHSTSSERTDGGSTGLIAGSNLEVEAAAGTYSVSVRFKTSAGAVYAKNRKLRVKSEAFG